MSQFKFVIDSCCEMTDELKQDQDVTVVPYSMTIGDTIYVDDENLDVKEFFKAMKSSKDYPKSGCPTPDDFEKVIDPQACTFGVTISSKLSACYDSYSKAKENILKKHPNAKIHCFDSQSASSGEILIFTLIRDYIKEGFSFEQIIEKVESYIEKQQFLFVLESLENLIKNGRMTKAAGVVASALSVCPVMEAKDGEILLYEKAIGIKKALNKLVDAIGKKCDNFTERRCVITHCNNLQRALDLKAKIQDRYNFSQIIVNETKGLSTMYADDGGILVAF